jgi:two-component system NtrC family sensor kinase
MKSPIRLKLVLSFIAVIVVAGIVATAAGIHLIGSGIVREAQNRVNLDLNSAHQIYEQKLNEIENVLKYTAIRRFAVQEALSRGDLAMLRVSLEKAKKEGNLDFLTVTGTKGRDVLRAGHPTVCAESSSRDAIVCRTLKTKKPCASTQIVPGEELLKESGVLAERACMKLIPTPKAKPTTETENTCGMILKAAVPVFDRRGEFLGVLQGGILLNRRYDIVDKIKDVVFRGETYEGKDIGTATIFQKDLRISTNVKHKDGKRAIGTRLSSAVYDRVLGEGKPWTARAFVVNDWYLTAYEPIRNIDGKVIGVLYVGVLEKKFADLKKKAFWIFSAVTALGVVLAVIIGWGLAHAMASPIQRLKEGVEALTQGDFDYDIHVRSSDEIGSLAASFSRVRQELKDTYAKLQGKIEAADEDLKRAYGELQEKQQQLVHAAKLASLGSLAAGVAHEINNPLGTILLYAQMTQEDLDEDVESCRENIGIIEKHATRAAGIVRNLLEFARKTDLEKRRIRINSILENVLSITNHQAELQQVEVEKALASDLPEIEGDTDKLRQVFINMVINALQVMPKGGRLTVKSAVTPDGTFAEVKISDTGCGIPKDKIDKVFDPFYTTKEAGKGTGLGLSVSHGIVEQHRGRIAVESEAGEGTTFTVLLPAMEAAPAGAKET